MPLLIEKSEDKFSFMVLEVNEDLSFFLDKFDICKLEKQEISNFSRHRLQEWWASRYLVYLLENKEKRSCVLKDDFGKPYLENSSKNISISHSGKKIAAVISNEVVGIDIQNISPKVELVKKKFLSGKELNFADDINTLNLMWTLKEAVYKAYGKKKLNFKENIIIKGFEKKNNEIHSEVNIEKSNTIIKYKVVSYNIKNAILSIAFEKINTQNFKIPNNE